MGRSAWRTKRGKIRETETETHQGRKSRRDRKKAEAET